MGSASDLNLLTGVIALQNQLITHDQLVAGLQAWFLEKEIPLAEHLVRLGSITTQQRHELEMLVNVNLRLHGNDLNKSMASFSSIGSALATKLEQLGDPDVNAMLSHWQAAHEGMSWDQGMATSAEAAAERAPTGTVRMGKPAEHGRVVGRFKILKHHARGGLGDVWIAQDLELGRKVAFKEIQDDKADYQTYRSRFVREAEVTSALEHPGIVPIYGMGQFANGRPYYAMRFLDSKTLFDEIDQFHLERVDPVLKLSPTELNLRLRRLLQRFIDICEAMDYAHTCGVLHRDLKPQNIMIGRYGETMVVDWGLAKVLSNTPETPQVTAADPESAALPDHATPVQSGDQDSNDATQHGSTIGTVLYMSPEQAHGRHDELKPTSDVFSLGAILYEILTGTTLYTGTYDQVLQAAKEANFKSPRRHDSQIAKPLEAICLKALHKEASQRYATAKLLAKDVESYLADEPTIAQKETWLVASSRWIRKNKKFATSLAASLILTIIFSLMAATLIANNNALEAEAQAEAFHNNLSQATNLAQTKPQGWDSLALAKLQVCEESLNKHPEYAPRLRGLKLKCQNAFNLKPDETIIPDFAAENLCMLRDNTILAVGETRVPFTKPLAQVVLFNLQTNTKLGELNHDFSSHIARGLGNLLNSKNLSATRAEGINALQAGLIGEREVLAVGSRFGEVFLWDLDQPKQPLARWTAIEGSAVNQIRFSKNRDRLIVWNKLEICVWDVTDITNKPARKVATLSLGKFRVEYDRLEDRILLFDSHETKLLVPETLAAANAQEDRWEQGFNHVVFSNDCRILLGIDTDNSELSLHHPSKNGERRLRFAEIPDLNSKVDYKNAYFSADNRYLAMVTSDRAIRIWECGSGELLGVTRLSETSDLDPAIAFLSGNDRIAVSDGTSVRIYQTNSTRLTRAEQRPGLELDSIRDVNSDADFAKILIRHQRNTNQYQRQDEFHYQVLPRIRTSSSATSLVMSANGKTIATHEARAKAADKDSIDLLQSQANGKYAKTFEALVAVDKTRPNSAELLTISPDGKVLWGRADIARGTIVRGMYLRCWDTGTRQETTQNRDPLISDLGRGDRRIECIAASNTLGIAGSSQGSISAVEYATGNVRQLSLGSAGCTTLALADQANLLAVGTTAGSIHLVDLNSWKIQHVIEAASLPIHSLAISSDGKRMAYAVQTNEVFVYENTGADWEQFLLYETFHAVRSLQLNRYGTELLLTLEKELSPIILKLPMT
jgi:serine/threonine protein kinase/WD40 repeat protein